MFNYLLRGVACAAPLAAVLAMGCFLVLKTHWKELNDSFDIRNPLAEEVEDDDEKDYDPNPESEQVMLRVELRSAIVIDVMEQRITLEAAIEQFRNMNMQEPHGMDHLRMVTRSATDEQALVRQILSFAEALVRTKTTLQGQPYERLQSEAQQYLEAAE